MDTIIAHKYMTIWQVKLAVQERDGISADAFELYCSFSISEEKCFSIQSTLGAVRQYIRPEVTLESIGLGHQRAIHTLFVDVNAREGLDATFSAESIPLGERRASIFGEPSQALRNKGTFSYDLVPANELFPLPVVYGAAFGATDSSGGAIVLSDEFSALRDRLAQGRSTILDGYRLLTAARASLPEDVRHVVLLAAEPKLTRITNDPQELAEFVNLNSLDVSANALPFHPLGGLPVLLNLQMACNGLRNLRLTVAPENQDYERNDHFIDLDQDDITESLNQDSSTQPEGNANANSHGLGEGEAVGRTHQGQGSSTPLSSFSSKERSSPGFVSFNSENVLSSSSLDYERFGFLPVRKRRTQNKTSHNNISGDTSSLKRPTTPEADSAPKTAASSTTDALPSTGLWESLLVAFGEAVERSQVSTESLSKTDRTSFVKKNPIDDRLSVVGEVLLNRSAKYHTPGIQLSSHFRPKSNDGENLHSSTRLGGRAGDVDSDVEDDFEDGEIQANDDATPEQNYKLNRDTGDFESDNLEPTSEEVSELIACQEVLFYPLQILLTKRYMQMYRHHLLICEGLSYQAQVRLNKEIEASLQEAELKRGLELLKTTTDVRRVSGQNSQSYDNTGSANKRDDFLLSDEQVSLFSKKLIPSGTASILTNPDDSTLLDLIALRHTDLFLRIPPYSLIDTCGFGTLTTLDLSYNSISPSSMLQLSVLPHLQSLNLTSNAVSYLPPDLSGFRSLKKLTLRRNGLGALLPHFHHRKESNSGKNNNLMSFSLRDAEVTEEVLLFLSLSTIPLIEEIDLSENNITKIPAPAAIARLGQRMTEMMTPPASDSFKKNSNDSSSLPCGLVPFEHALPLHFTDITSGTGSQITNMNGSSKSSTSSYSLVSDEFMKGRDERNIRWRRKIGFAYLTAQKPFKWLRALALSHNLIEDELSVVALGSFKRLNWIDLRGNPLTEALEFKDALPPLNRVYPILTEVFIENELLHAQPKKSFSRRGSSSRDVRIVMAQPRASSRSIVTSSFDREKPGQQQNPEPHILRPLLHMITMNRRDSSTSSRISSSVSPPTSPTSSLLSTRNSVIAMSGIDGYSRSEPPSELSVGSDRSISTHNSNVSGDAYPRDPNDNNGRSTSKPLLSDVRQSEITLKKILSRPIGEFQTGLLPHSRTRKSDQVRLLSSMSTMSSYHRQVSTMKQTQIRMQDRRTGSKMMIDSNGKESEDNSLSRGGKNVIAKKAQCDDPNVSIHMKRQINNAVKQVEMIYGSSNRSSNSARLLDELDKKSCKGTVISASASLSPKRRLKPSEELNSRQHLDQLVKIRERRREEQVAKDVELLLYTVSSTVAHDLWGATDK